MSPLPVAEMLPVLRTPSLSLPVGPPVPSNSRLPVPVVAIVPMFSIPCWIPLLSVPPRPVSATVPLIDRTTPPDKSLMPMNEPVLDVVCWLASKVKFPFWVSMLALPLMDRFLLTFTVAVPVPKSSKLALLATTKTSVPGVASSFCKSTSRLAFVAKLMSPLKFTWSSPSPPLMVRLGRFAVKAEILMTSLPVAVLITILVMPASATSAGVVKSVAGAPLME